MQRLFVSTAIGALSLMVTGTAHADCDAVTGIAEWQSVTCDSTSVFDGPDAVETRGISAENDDIFVRVTPGAVINTQQSGSSAIDLSDSTGGFVDNEGEILAGSQGIQGGSVYVFNSGDIAAVEQAIQANESAAGVYNSQNSTIQSSTNNAIEAEGYVTLENRGAVLGFGGVIQAEGADIENYGLIESTQTVEDLSSGPAIEAQDAINLDHGRIYNEGTILRPLDPQLISVLVCTQHGSSTNLGLYLAQLVSQLMRRTLLGKKLRISLAPSPVLRAPLFLWGGGLMSCCSSADP